MSYASEILARAYEDSNGPYPDMSSKDVVSEFRRIDKELKLLQLLQGVRVADNYLVKGGDVILIFKNDGGLEIRGYRNARTALDNLFQLEDKFENEDVVLVRGATSHDVRLAYQNYFGDTSDFIKLIKDGSEKILQ